jgi:phage terminase large subunit GpA-like protein
VQEWVKPSHRRNEVLDCTVYALAAAYHLGMNKFSDRDWLRLEEIVQPITADLFDNNGQNSVENGSKTVQNGKKAAQTAQKKHKVVKKKPLKARRKRKSTGFVARR